MKDNKEDTDDLASLARDAEEWVEAEEEAEAGATPSSDELKYLKEALGRKTREADEIQDKYVRAYAEFENYRKRSQRDLAEFRKYANEQLALELLPVVDHLGLALKHASEAGETNEGLREGVELVYKQFRDALEKFGVKTFKAEGEPFDPAKHDAVMQEVTDSVPENTVARVLQDGYLFHDKVLRHAKVSVAKKPETTEKSGTRSE